ncbi:MAG: hypothetical protein ACI9UA_001768 [Pseudoalteromonas tetraodonis]|jgi:hypothetical protein
MTPFGAQAVIASIQRINHAFGQCGQSKRRQKRRSGDDDFHSPVYCPQTQKSII